MEHGICCLHVPVCVQVPGVMVPGESSWIVMHESLLNEPPGVPLQPPHQTGSADMLLPAVAAKAQHATRIAIFIPAPFRLVLPVVTDLLLNRPAVTAPPSRALYLIVCVDRKDRIASRLRLFQAFSSLAESSSSLHSPNGMRT
jgi:hypothetical protein